MAEQNKSQRCSKDASAIPWQAYRLSTDGRKCRAVCEQRRALVIQLAGFANPDGTKIEVGHLRLMSELGWAHRSLFRRFKELSTIGVLITDTQHVSEHGVALRRLNLSMLGATVPNRQPQCQIDNEPQCQIAEPQCQIEKPQCQIEQKKGATVPHMGGTQPLLPPKEQPPTANQNLGGGKSLAEKHPAIAYGKRTELDALVAEFSYDTMERLLAELETDDFVGVKSPVAVVWSSRLPKRLAEERAKRAAAVEQIKRDAFQAASIERQNAEIREQWKAKPQDGETIEDFLN